MKMLNAIGAAFGALSTYVSVVQEAAMQLFGVPLPVVLGALTGACGARVFLAEAPFWRASLTSLMWTAVGAFGTELAAWLISLWLGATPSKGALAGIALVIAALGQRAAPIVWESGGEALKRFLDSISRRTS